MSFIVYIIYHVILVEVNVQHPECTFPPNNFSLACRIINTCKYNISKDLHGIYVQCIITFRYLAIYFLIMSFTLIIKIGLFLYLIYI
jgi:hypothetical protein